MAINNWKKCENEAGFPYYIRDESCVKQWDHPAFADILSKMNQACDIRYAVYRMAYKIMSLQESFQVPSVRIISGVFAHHCLSLSESSFLLEPCELEAILTDIYFAANKEGTFDGDIDTATEIALNFLLNVYDRERTSSISVQSAKTGLALVSGGPGAEAWAFLLALVADHNGCARPRRLAALLTRVAQLAEFLGEGATYGRHAVQQEVDKCFAKTPGMLGLSEHGLLEWLESGPALLSWTEVRERLRLLKSSSVSEHQLFPWKCALCSVRNPAGLKFKCTRCWGMMLCERCYLYNDVKPATAVHIIHRHKKSHSVKEITDSQGMPSKCVVGFVRNMKKILNCPSVWRRTSHNSPSITYPLHHHPSEKEDRIPGDAPAEEQSGEERKGNNRNMFTSTVGKASGRMISDPKMVLQDIIAQLESQNKALKNLSIVLSDAQQVNSMDRRIQHKVDNHWGQIAVQINRLKMFKSIFQENLPEQEAQGVLRGGLDKTLPRQQHIGMDAFEAFSPIPAMIKESTVMEHKAIVPSADHGDSSNTPVLHYYDDSISKVSMGDISTWFANVSDADKVSKDPPSLPGREFPGAPHSAPPGPSTSEDKFNADLESVATSNTKMKELNADLDSVLDRLQSILANNFSLDETSFDNTQLKETANEMEGLLGTLIRGVEQRRTIKGDKI